MNGQTAFGPEPERVERARTPVRGVTPRDLEHELADWTCAGQDTLAG